MPVSPPSSGTMTEPVLRDVGTPVRLGPGRSFRACRWRFGLRSQLIHRGSAFWFAERKNFSADLFWCVLLNEMFRGWEGDCSTVGEMSLESFALAFLKAPIRLSPHEKNGLVPQPFQPRLHLSKVVAAREDLSGEDSRRQPRCRRRKWSSVSGLLRGCQCS